MYIIAFTGNKLSFNRKHKEILHKKITTSCLLALLLAGCQKPATKEPESIAVNEETSQPAITVPEKQEPVQAKEKKLSEIYDWEKARIIDYSYNLDFGEGQVLQNQDYVFYPEDGCKIARIDKADGTKKLYAGSVPTQDTYITAFQMTGCLLKITAMFIPVALMAKTCIK